MKLSLCRLRPEWAAHNNGPKLRLAEPRVAEGRGSCLVTRKRAREREMKKVQVRVQLSNTVSS